MLKPRQKELKTVCADNYSPVRCATLSGKAKRAPGDLRGGVGQICIITNNSSVVATQFRLKRHDPVRAADKPPHTGPQVIKGPQ